MLKNQKGCSSETMKTFWFVVSKLEFTKKYGFLINMYPQDNFQKLLFLLRLHLLHHQ